MMNRKIFYLSILLIGFSASAIYGTGSIVTDTDVSTNTVNAVDGIYSNSVNTKDLTVTGTCTGCGSGGSGSSEGNFTSWTLTTNSSASRLGGVTPASVIVDNNGTTIVKGLNYKAIVIARNGTTILLDNTGTFTNGGISLIGQSFAGKYQFVNLQSNGHLQIYKSGILVQDITLNFVNAFASKTQIGTGISPDGKYIIVYGASNVGGQDRILTYQGT